MLNKHNIYLKLSIDSINSEQFSAVALPAYYRSELQGNEKEIINFWRTNYSSKENYEERQLKLL